MAVKAGLDIVHLTGVVWGFEISKRYVAHRQAVAALLKMRRAPERTGFAQLISTKRNDPVMFVREVFKALWGAVQRLNDDGGLAIASNIALSLLLSLFPFLMLVAAIVRLYGDPALAEEVVNLLLGHWPADSAKPIADQVKILLSQNPSEFFSFSTLIVLILATNGVESARDGLNRAYKFTETRSFFWRRLQGALFVLVGAGGFIAVAFLLVAAPLLWDFLLTRLPILEPFQTSFTLFQNGLAFVILGIVLFCFHRYLPDGRQKLRHIIWGILVTIVSIFIGSALFGFYLESIANYTALYAGLAGMMVAIVYLYCLSVLILFGAELNTALLEHGLIKK